MSTVDVEAGAMSKAKTTAGAELATRSSWQTLEHYIAFNIGAASANASAGGIGGIAMGAEASASGNSSVAISTGTAATHLGSIALGVAAKSAANCAIAVGYAANAADDSSIAIGLFSSTTKSGVALGSRSSVAHGNAVALGPNSTSTKDNSVSIGSVEFQRTICNVADGELASSSRDAVTGRQLFATNQKVSAHEAAIVSNTENIAAARTQIGDLAEQVNSGGIGLVQQDGGSQAVTIGAATGGGLINAAGTNGPRRFTGLSEGQDATDAATFGQLSPLLAKVRFLAVNGRTDAEVNGTDALALGGGASAQNEYSVALGSKAVAGGSYDVAIGRSAKAVSELTSGGYYYTGVAVGYKSVAQSSGIAVGQSAVAAFRGSVAMGTGAHVASLYAVCIGQQAVSAAEATVVLGKRAVCGEQATNAVALGAASIAFEADTVSVGNNELKRRLTNVAPGFSEDDAVTMGQLFGLRQAHQQRERDAEARYQQLEQKYDALHELVRQLSAKVG